MKFKIGDYVKKVSGDYTSDGIVVSAFTKINGLERYVVEITAEGALGMLMIYSEANLAFRCPVCNSASEFRLADHESCETCTKLY